MHVVLTDLSVQRELIEGTVDAILARGATLDGAVAPMAAMFQAMFAGVPPAAISRLVVEAVAGSPFNPDNAPD